jgi:hypothetical protein
MIKRIIEGFLEENDDAFHVGHGFAAFKRYHEIREKRYNLEIEQSFYFLEEQRIEGKPPYNNQQQQE